jgi:hypothetical protein
MYALLAAIARRDDVATATLDPRPAAMIEAGTAPLIEAFAAVDLPVRRFAL